MYNPKILTTFALVKQGTDESAETEKRNTHNYNIIKLL